MRNYLNRGFQNDGWADFAVSMTCGTGEAFQQPSVLTAAQLLTR